MRDFPLSVFLLISAAAASGCIERRAYVCSANGQCQRDRQDGYCEANGYCAYPDTQCPSGRRFEELAPQVGGECVATADETDVTGVTTNASSSAPTITLSGTTSGATTGTATTVTTRGESGSSSTTEAPFACVEPGCEWVSLDAGEFHVCAVNARSEVYCWGANLQDQLGIPNGPTFVSGPRQTIRLGGDVALATHDHSCVISEGSLRCWGPNGLGQADWASGDASVDQPTLLSIKGFTPQVIATGSGRSCAADGRSLACWGGAAGSAPAVFQVGAPMEELAVGSQHQCTRVDSGEVYCNGGNALGQLGDGMGDAGGSMPVQALLGSVRAVSIDAGGDHTCAITRSDTQGEARNIVCWGDNAWLEAGSVGSARVLAPTQISGDLVAGDWVDVDAAEDHTCALSGDGSVWCWGKNEYGRADPRADVEWTGLSRRIELDSVDLVASDIATGNAQTCALNEDGVIWCWGCLTPWVLLGDPAEAECPESDGAEAAYPPPSE